MLRCLMLIVLMLTPDAVGAGSVDGDGAASRAGAVGVYLPEDEYLLVRGPKAYGQRNIATIRPGWNSC